jgi:hypothetical protein
MTRAEIGGRSLRSGWWSRGLLRGIKLLRPGRNCEKQNAKSQTESLEAHFALPQTVNFKRSPKSLPNPRTPRYQKCYLINERNL